MFADLCEGSHMSRNRWANYMRYKMLLSKSLNLFKSFVVDPYFHDLVKKASFMRYQHIHQVGLMSSDDA